MGDYSRKALFAEVSPTEPGSDIERTGELRHDPTRPFNARKVDHEEATTLRGDRVERRFAAVEVGGYGAPTLGTAKRSSGSPHRRVLTTTSTDCRRSGRSGPSARADISGPTTREVSFCALRWSPCDVQFSWGSGKCAVRPKPRLSHPRQWGSLLEEQLSRHGMPWVRDHGVYSTNDHNGPVGRQEAFG
jgi:hypothetical protein